MTHTQRAEGVEVRKWTADKMDMKVRRVCGECNHGWMSTLEKTARMVIVPMMAGRVKRLVPSEQEVVAVWAIKTALMCGFTNPGPYITSPEHFHSLYNGLKPPRNAHVWLARYVAPERLDYNHRVLQLPGAGRVPDRLGYLSAFIINRLVLYVMDAESPGGAVTRTVLSEEAERHAVPIQPIKYPVVRWPPEFSVDNEGIEQFLLSIAPERGEFPAT